MRASRPYDEENCTSQYEREYADRRNDEYERYVSAIRAEIEDEFQQYEYER